MGGKPKTNGRCLYGSDGGGFWEEFFKTNKGGLEVHRVGENGLNLKVKDWREFQLQFEVAADRVEDNGDRE